MSSREERLHFSRLLVSIRAKRSESQENHNRQEMAYPVNQDADYDCLLCSTQRRPHHRAN